MIFDFVMQILSIVGVSFVILYLRTRFLLMEYGFIKILVNALMGNFHPFDWLIDNIQYLGFLMIFIGHLFTLSGLLHQLGNGHVHTKPLEFFFSSPLNNFGYIIGLMGLYRKVYIRRFF